ncbi:hypothetical protein BDV96DRAFT_561648 [Lophiotrema nucula]|uniref:Uncharacterized protein n=1 Tax=Lophiotrema nucula TaxID=690887 RepID=A0A6A5ZTV6_9PLEO|nr:hypothetical protein BDV96DRAFT_561648 [Lophiotrema nucula]
MKRAVPAAMERFQDSLDELENELHMAQAVLRRDLAVVQNERLERERKEKEERERRENAKKATPVKPQPSPEQKKIIPTKQEAVTVDAPAAQPETKEEPKKEPEPPPPINTTKEVEERDPLFDPTPTTANPQDQDQEFDFDAMFGDPTLDDPSNGNGDGMDTTGPDLNFTLDDPDSGPSLLRGLEDFAKSSDDPAPADISNDNNTINLDDFTMPDLPDLPTTQPEDPQPEASKAPEVTMTEPTLDTTTNDFDMMMDTTTDLDDLFNIDPENPETTAFDDAFTFFDAN